MDFSYLGSFVGASTVMLPSNGKVLDYWTANARCSQCDVDERRGKSTDHDCRKNYQGSAKGSIFDI